MSTSFRLAARQAETLLTAGDLASAAPQVAALQPSTPLESYVAAELRMELASRRGDAQAQRRALTDMLESKAVPTGQEAYLRYLAGYYSYYLGAFDDAVAQVNYARQLGYNGVDTTVLLSDTMIKKGKPADGLALMDQAMEQLRANGKPVPASWYDRAVGVSYKAGAWNDVAKYCQRKLALFSTPGNWRTCITNYLAAPGQDAQLKLDFYRLQSATGAMASERDYQNYATLAASEGYEAEAKSIIESGRTNGKLSSKDAVTVALMKTATPKAAKTIAGLPALAKKAAAAPTGVASLGVGDTYLSLGQYPQAAVQYRQALSKGGVDVARTNVRLGIALARSADLPGGRAALALAVGNWANVAGFWSVWLEQQVQANPVPAPAGT
jgi:tetratricopeptide (TPR) repeat protein